MYVCYIYTYICRIYVEYMYNICIYVYMYICMYVYIHILFCWVCENVSLWNRHKSPQSFKSLYRERDCISIYLRIERELVIIYMQVYVHMYT